MKRLVAVLGCDVSRETCEKLERFAALLIEENRFQNLISRASEAHLWNRHILDSAQLLKFASKEKSWSDIGTGPGLPGIVLAILDQGPKRLIEPRRRRIDFLQRVVTALILDNVEVFLGKAGAIVGQSDIITARAVASPEALLAMTSHLRHAGTITVLPRGKNAHSELAALQKTWQGTFRLHPSLTNDEAAILVAKDVRPRGKR